MFLPIVTRDSSFGQVNRKIFVNFWMFFYTYPDDAYLMNIGKPLTNDRVFALFEWKNGNKLSERKILSIKENYIASGVEPPEGTRDKGKLLDYLKKFKSTVWPIFWLHINNPSIFPIYDQHVFRAMRYITEQKICEPPRSSLSFSETYASGYIPFFASFSGIPWRNVDKALMSFGKFIKKKQMASSDSFPSIAKKQA